MPGRTPRDITDDIFDEDDNMTLEEELDLMKTDIQQNADDIDNITAGTKPKWKSWFGV